MKDQTKIQLKEEFESYIKKNALGLVCECGGGGTDDNNTWHVWWPFWLFIIIHTVAAIEKSKHYEKK